MGEAAPQNLDAEEYVLGAMMLSPKAIDAVVEVLAPADFYRRSHGVIYAAAADMYQRGEPVDPVTLCAELDRAGTLEDAGGPSRVNELAAIVPSTSAAPHYAGLVREAATLRGLRTASARISAMVGEREGRTAMQVVDEAEQLLFDLAQARSSSDFVPLSEAVRESYDEITALQEAGREFTGTPSGFADLDRLTSGYQRGNLVVVASRPSMGKSALAIGTVAHVGLELGLPVALFTLEMSRREVAHRMISARSLVESQQIRTGRIPRGEWPRVTAACDALARAPVFIDDAGAPTMLEIRSKARRLKGRYPDLALVVVDYLQLMSGEAENRVQEISKISRGLKVLAGELDVPVLAVSQLSRQVEQRHDKRPILSDLRESGSIEQDADLVVFLYRDEYYNPDEVDQQGVAEVHLAKQRNGPTGTVKLAFVKKLAKFTALHIPGDVGTRTT